MAAVCDGADGDHGNSHSGISDDSNGVTSVPKEPKKPWRLESLPGVEKDFASLKWTEHNDGSLAGEVENYNAYMEAFEDIQSGKLELDGVDGPQLAHDLKSYINAEFRKKLIPAYDRDNNYHKALYAHCVRRYLQQIRLGVYRGFEGRTEKRPQVADAIEQHIDTILTNKFAGV